MRLHGFARAPAQWGEEGVRWTETEKPLISTTSSFVVEKPAFGGALSCSKRVELRSGPAMTPPLMEMPLRKCWEIQKRIK